MTERGNDDFALDSSHPTLVLSRRAFAPLVSPRSSPRGGFFNALPLTSPRVRRSPVRTRTISCTYRNPTNTRAESALVTARGSDVDVYCPIEIRGAYFGYVRGRQISPSGSRRTVRHRICPYIMYVWHIAQHVLLLRGV